MHACMYACNIYFLGCRATPRVAEKARLASHERRELARKYESVLLLPHHTRDRGGVVVGKTGGDRWKEIFPPIPDRVLNAAEGEVTVTTRTLSCPTRNALAGPSQFISCVQVSYNQHAVNYKSAKYSQMPMPTLVPKRYLAAPRLHICHRCYTQYNI